VSSRARTPSDDVGTPANTADGSVGARDHPLCSTRLPPHAFNLAISLHVYMAVHTTMGEGGEVSWAIEEVVARQVFKGRRTSLRAGSASQVFTRSRTAFEDKGAGHGLRATRARTCLQNRCGELPGGFDSRPPPPSGVGVALTLRGCKSPPPARTRPPAFVPFVRFGPGARTDRPGPGAR
jgi:hypothetical protein